MKIYKTQKQIEADIVNDVLTVEGNVKFECSFTIGAKIVVKGNIDAYDIMANNIKANNIDAGYIKANNIDAYNIHAGDITFHAVAFAYESFVCKSIKGRRENSKFFCLDKEVKIKKYD